MTARELASRIDHTFLKAAGAPEAIEVLCDEARRYRFACAMVNPAEVARAAALLEGSGVRVGTVVGFPLYSVGMVCGLFYAGAVYGRTVTGDPKEIISFATWVLYAVLFHNRLARGWYGRKPARLMVLIFILCAVSFVVVNLFMTSHHSFART